MIIIRDFENLKKELKQPYGDDKIILINEDFYKHHKDELKDLIEAANLDIGITQLNKNIISIIMDKCYLGDE